MSLLKYMGRLKRDFQLTFDTDHGRHVLVHLYTKLGANKTSYSPGCSATDLAFGEGKRFAWLIILEQLREEDQDMRKYLEEHIAERRREEDME